MRLFSVLEVLVGLQLLQVLVSAEENDLECGVRGLYNGQPIKSVKATSLDGCVFAARSHTAG